MIFNIEESLCDMSGIYSITTSIDNRFYIGSTINFWRRYVDHRAKFKKGNHANKYMQAFASKYGLNTFSFNLLFICKNSCLIHSEKFWIEVLRPQFNIKPIIQRPYIEDVARYDLEKRRRLIEPIYESMGVGLDDRYTIKKYKHLEHLTVTQELHYYSGIPVFSAYPKKVKNNHEDPTVAPKYISKEGRSERSKRLSRVIRECRNESRNSS